MSRNTAPVSARAEHPYLHRRDLPCTSGAHDPDVWFSPDTSEAKALCRACPVMDGCARWAVDTEQTAGVWGALTPAEIQSARRRPWLR